MDTEQVIKSSQQEIHAHLNRIAEAEAKLDEMRHSQVLPSPFCTHSDARECAHECSALYLIREGPF
jgi:hypothetical protein